jgi:hypothetical protein
MRLPLLLTALLIGLVGCATRYEVRADWDEATDFSVYRTWAFPADKPPDTAGMLDNTLVRRRIENLLAARLAAEGLTMAEAPARPDLVVRYWLGTRDRVRVDRVGASPFAHPWGPRWSGRWTTWHEETVVREYVEGVLVIDLVDARRDELVWRAYLAGALEPDRERLYTDLAAALDQAFQSYPPQDH